MFCNVGMLLRCWCYCAVDDSMYVLFICNFRIEECRTYEGESFDFLKGRYLEGYGGGSHGLVGSVTHCW